MRHAMTENDRGPCAFVTAWLLPVMLLAWGSSLAAPVELGRLFYTPAQRAQLEASRTHGAQNAASGAQAATGAAPAPLRFDGLVIRSDGKTTRWIDGKPQLGTSPVTGLKPGQIRAGGKVYEPYQVLRPSPGAGPGVNTEESTP